MLYLSVAPDSPDPQSILKYNFIVCRYNLQPLPSIKIYLLYMENLKGF